MARRTLTVLYVTFRGLRPFIDPGLKILSQYDTLAESLKTQRVDFELVIVDQSNPLPRPELAWLGDRVKYARPRSTPWRRRSLFCASSARNAGLLDEEGREVASGDVVLGLDDCVSFSGDLLEIVLRYADRDQYLVPAYRLAKMHTAIGQPRRQERAGGILAYPRRTALDLGMHEERMDATKVLEDYEFSERLVREGGVQLVSDGNSVTLHRHARLRAGKRAERCGILIHHLLRGSRRANEPWTDEQLAHVASPCKLRAGIRCQITGGTCEQPHAPPPKAVEIMRTYESSAWLRWNRLEQQPPP